MTQLRVLLVGSGDKCTSTLASLVLRQGYQLCGFVFDPEHARLLASTCSPDVVLCNVHQSGLDLDEPALRDFLRTAGVPVILVAGAPALKSLQECDTVGIDGILSPPVRPEPLQAALRIAANQAAVREKAREYARLRRLLDNFPAGLYVSHPSGYYTAANQVQAAMLGYSSPEALLASVRSLDGQVYVQPGRQAEITARLQEEGGVPSVMESQVYGCDGDIFWVREHLIPEMDANGALHSYEGIVLNITEQREADADRDVAFNLAQNTVDAIVDLVAVVDLDGNLIMSNAAFARELAPVLALEGLPLPELLQDGSGLLPRFLHTLRHVPEAAQSERGTVCVPGYGTGLDVRVSCFKAPDGTALGAVLVMRPLVE